MTDDRSAEEIIQENLTRLDDIRTDAVIEAVAMSEQKWHANKMAVLAAVHQQGDSDVTERIGLFVAEVERLRAG